jgi:hypothetical protein
MAYLEQRTSAQSTRETARFDYKSPDTQPPNAQYRSLPAIQLSAQEQELVTAGLGYGSPFLRLVWQWTKPRIGYGKLSAPMTPLLGRMVIIGLATLERKINQKLRLETSAEEEDTLINDLHSIQLTLKRITAPEGIRGFVQRTGA